MERFNINGASVPFHYHVIRNISSGDDTGSGRRIYSGQAPATSILELPDDENVREYLVEADGKMRQSTTQVHRAMRDTLENKPQDFCVLNGGVVILAEHVEIDEKGHIATLSNPSIINGSQTQGELKRYFRSEQTEKYPVTITFEIIETSDPELVAEVSIARNFQNDVARLSIAGRRGQLDELEKSLGTTLRKRETDMTANYADTEKILQVITALLPDELWPNPKEVPNPSKVYTYSVKSKCLRDFQNLYVKAKDDEKPDLKARERYQFFLDVAPIADMLYRKWKTHQGFKGTKLRSLTRDDENNIVDVPDGMIFPILASLSAFARKADGKWTIDIPDSQLDAELIKAAKTVYMEIASSNPWNMGKSKACYSHLLQITSIYSRFIQGQEQIGQPAFALNE